MNDNPLEDLIDFNIFRKVKLLVNFSVVTIKMRVNPEPISDKIFS
jgi:hypothetical protein